METLIVVQVADLKNNMSKAFCHTPHFLICTSAQNHNEWSHEFYFSGQSVKIATRYTKKMTNKKENKRKSILCLYQLPAFYDSINYHVIKEIKNCKTFTRWSYKKQTRHYKV